MRVAKRVASLALILACLPAGKLLAQATAPAAAAGGATTGAAGGQTWTQETLANGLRVVYVPMPTSPATQVRVIYHVGSRDERSDRQGFAHMFEHMMFRGSEHVKPEEHMKLVGMVGISNAFTSFDETVYHDTLPANYTEMALWLEADRMSSFKVSQAILQTERQVVGEEFRLRANQPYGTMFDQLMPAVFKTHPYQWTPIGNMEQLQAAHAPELQEFFNKYYVPNNAILVVAGPIDIEKARGLVKKYYEWIPGKSWMSGLTVIPAEVDRKISKEPEQKEPRRVEVKMPAPLARVVVAYHMPPANSPDDDAINLMMSVLGDGQSSRLYKALVTTDNPLCEGADSYAMYLEDGGVMGAMATLLPGKKEADAEKVLRAEIAKMRDTPPTADELEKVKQQNRMALAQRFETADSAATEIGNSMLTYGDLTHVTTARARLEAVTPADLQRVAKKYLVDAGSTTMIITPGSPPPPVSTLGPIPPAGAASAPAPVATIVKFPADYPTAPPMTGKLPDATFEKGVSTDITLPKAAAPGQVIVMEDHRMPVINWSLNLRAGSYAEPDGKQGLASLTAEMVRRGPKGKTFDQFNEELESRAIGLDVSDGGDFTRISGTCLKEQFPFANNETTAMLLTPAFDPEEFARLKDQSIAQLRLSLNNAQVVASRTLTHALYGDSVLGRLTTPESLAAITLDDVKQFYKTIYRSDGAVLAISGDVVVADAQKTGTNLLAGMPSGDLPKVTYTLPKPPEKSRIILVDRPESRQSSIRMGVRAYSIESDEKFAGSLANQILSNGIESRLGRYVRAEKGYVYGITGIFSPTRQAGVFYVQTDTKFETTADTVTATFKVLNDMRKDNVATGELADAKFRVAGGLLMTMQTIADQSSRRVDGVLNHYPIDYYDKYAQRISQVSADQIKENMTKYVLEDHMVVVVVGPAAILKTQLEKLGPVEVVTPAK